MAFFTWQKSNETLGVVILPNGRFRRIRPGDDVRIETSVTATGTPFVSEQEEFSSALYTLTFNGAVLCRTAKMIHRQWMRDPIPLYVFR